MAGLKRCGFAVAFYAEAFTKGRHFRMRIRVGRLSHGLRALEQS